MYHIQYSKNPYQTQHFHPTAYNWYWVAKYAAWRLSRRPGLRVKGIYDDGMGMHQAMRHNIILALGILAALTSLIGAVWEVYYVFFQHH